MNPFEDLIRQLSASMNIVLHPDAHQSCLLSFEQDELSIQIDLDNNGDRILVGTQLGRITPGAYRERIFTEALKVNGSAQVPLGILAFSEKNDTLVLFQYLPLRSLTGEKLNSFIMGFREHAKVWKEALTLGTIPLLEKESASGGDKMFGLKP